MRLHILPLLAGLVISTPVAAQMNVAPGPEGAPAPRKAVPEYSMFPDRGVLVVHLPGDGELYIDHVYVKSGSSERAFVTPELLPDATFFYDVQVNILRDGRLFAQTQRVLLRPGEVSRVFFGDFREPFAPGYN